MLLQLNPVKFHQTISFHPKNDPKVTVQIPNEIMLTIFEHLNPEEQGKARKVCKSWKMLLEDTSFLQFQLRRIAGIPFFKGKNLTALLTASSIPPSTALRVAEGFFRELIGAERKIRPLLITSTTDITEITELTNPDKAEFLLRFCEMLPKTVQTSLRSLENPQLSSLQKAIFLTEELQHSKSVKNLTSLDLSWKSFLKIPFQIKYFTALKNLNLNGNALSTLPEEIQDLTHLTHLNLSLTDLRILPGWIYFFRHLTDLDLSGNQLESLPRQTKYLISLTRLNLYWNQLSFQEDWSWLRFLTHLTDLNLARNCLTNVPNEIQYLKNLTYLDISNNELAFLPDWIVTLPKLRVLCIDKKVSLPSKLCPPKLQIIRK